MTKITLTTPTFKTVAFLLFICFCNLSLGQNLLEPAKKDSVLKPIPMKVIINNIVADRMEDSKLNLENNQTIRRQNIAFNLINAEIQNANAML